MRSYKFFDLWSQAILVLAIITGYLADTTGAVAGVSIIAYPVLQIISLLVHLFHGPAAWKEKRLRKIHILGTAAVIAVMLFAMGQRPKEKYDLLPGIDIIIYALIPAGILALFYTVITFLEWKKIKNSAP